MKKIALSLLFAMIVWTGSAHEPEHLAIAHIPINGLTTMFISDMQNRGYDIIHHSEYGTIMSGKFEGYTDCRFYIQDYLAQNGNKFVYRVVISLPKQTSWSSIEKQYFHLKQFLTEKFGKPTLCTEEFQCAIQPQDESTKFYELLLGKCSFHSTYKVEQGDIILTISSNFDKAHIVLYYTDAINEAQRQIANLNLNDL